MILWVALGYVEFLQSVFLADLWISTRIGRSIVFTEIGVITMLDIARQTACIPDTYISSKHDPEGADHD
jgi:hypothetical protein